MGIDIDKTANIIGTIRKMTNRELAVVVFLVISVVGLVGLVETRYAKLTETQEKIKLHQEKMASVQNQILNVVNSLPADIRNEIIQRGAVARAITVDPNKFVNSN